MTIETHHEIIGPSKEQLAALRLLASTDQGNARRFVLRFSHEVCWAPGKGWLYFNGRLWTPTNARDAAFERAKAVARDIALESNSSWCKASQNSGRLNAMLQCARSELVRPLNQFDQDPLALEVTNGVLRFFRHDDGGHGVRLDPARASDFITRSAAVPYEAQAEAPLWRAHLERIQPDAEMRAYLQRLFGYCLLGSTREHAVFLLHGNGGDGKTTTVNVVARILDEYATPIDAKLFIQISRIQSADAPSPALASLAGDVRLACAAEPPAGARLDESFLKLLSGGSPLKARMPHKEFLQFKPRCKILIECNRLPRIHGTDQGIRRRLFVVPFKAQLAREVMDLDLDAKLWNEAPGILRWMVEGAQQYLDRGLAPPAPVLEATAAYCGQDRKIEAPDAPAGPVFEWLNECVERRNQYQAPQIELLQSYRAYCASRHLTPLRRKQFVGALEAFGLRRRPTLDADNRIAWLGGRLAPA